MMSHSSQATNRDAKIDQLKRLIAGGKYETQEMLEDAVDALLWSEQDRLQEAKATSRQVTRLHPK
jgi:hypothetical protein